MEKQVKKISVVPTERDFSILKSLYEFVVLSFPQISKMHFQGKAKPTIVNRLTKLEESGLIQRLKIPRLQLNKEVGLISVVFQITRLGILILQKQYPGFELRQDPVRLRPYSVDHDLLLVDVMMAFKNKFPGSKIIHGELYFNNQSPSTLKPDVILVLPNGQGKIAVELELTAKSEKRYRELILKYRLAKDFTKVLYVTSHRQIEVKIKGILGSSLVNERFEFMQLVELFPQEPANLISKNNNSIHPLDERKEHLL